MHNSFQHANFIINVVSTSTKHNDELLANQAEEIAHEIELGELDTGRGRIRCPRYRGQGTLDEVCWENGF